MARKRKTVETETDTLVLDTPAIDTTPAIDVPVLIGPDDELVGDDGAGGFEPTSRSIVRAKYRREYAKTHRSCWDTIAKELRAYLFDDEDGELLNHAKMVRFGGANDCWQDTYGRLNPGQIRMNIGNRLRAKVRKGHEVVWVD